METLSHSNVELIDRLFSLSNRCAIGDSAAMSELLASYHADAEMTPRPNGGWAANGSAEEVIRSYFDEIARRYYVWLSHADELRDHGDCVLALGGIRTVDRETRDDRETAVGWVFRIRDGKVGAVEAYSSYTDAVASVRG